MKNALILLAGGSGKRLGGKDPKQFLKIDGINLLEYFLSYLDPNLFDAIIIATKKNDKNKYLKFLKKRFDNHRIIFSLAGKTRQISSKNSLKILKKYNPINVLIHDAARPLVSNYLIKKIISKLDTNYSCVPYVLHNDFIKSKKNIFINSNDIFHIQTPQGFKYKNIYRAHMINGDINLRDDSSVLESSGEKVKMLKGELSNIKITTKSDLEYFKKIKPKKFLSGIGYDIHRIDKNSKKKLKLCGLIINHYPLIGHSDADVGYHAICDSILGSLSMRDMGYYFNNKNIKWKNINSEIFLKFCLSKLTEKNYKIANLDINFICETPNINKLARIMKKNISKLLQIQIKTISIKATTNEKTGIIGKGEAIAAEAIVQIENV